MEEAGNGQQQPQPTAPAPTKKRRTKGAKAKPKKKGKGRSKASSGQVRFPVSYIDPELRKALDRAAKAAGVSTSEHVLMIIEKALR